MLSLVPDQQVVAGALALNSLAESCRKLLRRAHQGASRHRLNNAQDVLSGMIDLAHHQLQVVLGAPMFCNIADHGKC
jgi:hypothetical protein